MKNIDTLLLQILHSARRQPLLYRFTLGISIMLAVGFIPTGMVKVLGFRFSSLNPDHETGAFFEILYQSGYYWKFLGATQIMAGILILFKRTATLGSVMFVAIISNIFFITISYDFSGTPIITFAMLMASLWLVFWNWYRIRPLLFVDPPLNVSIPDPTLHNTFEQAVYVMGFVSGLVVFSVLRGLIIPMPVFYSSLAGMALSFILAVVLGVLHRNSQK